MSSSKHTFEMNIQLDMECRTNPDFYTDSNIVSLDNPTNHETQLYSDTIQETIENKMREDFDFYGNATPEIYKDLDEISYIVMDTSNSVVSFHLRWNRQITLDEGLEVTTDIADSVRAYWFDRCHIMLDRGLVAIRHDEAGIEYPKEDREDMGEYDPDYDCYDFPVVQAPRRSEDRRIYNRDDHSGDVYDNLGMYEGDMETLDWEVADIRDLPREPSEYNMLYVGYPTVGAFDTEVSGLLDQEEMQDEQSEAILASVVNSSVYSVSLPETA